MSQSFVYRNYLYLAGIKVPFITASVSSSFGSLASLNIELNYSPYINHIHKYTKIQFWEQKIDDKGAVYNPTLEFDGVVIGIVRSKNVLGNVSCRLTCLTDGVIWNQRKQYNYYLDQIANTDIRLTDDILNLRADGKIDPYIPSLIEENKFDVGCAVAAILTSDTNCTKGADSEQTLVKLSYNYIYNGKKYYKNLTSDTTTTGSSSLPTYYKKFLETYYLSNKLYGVSTAQNVKDFFNTDRSLNLITDNMVNDLIGENTFWNIANAVMQYGFYSVYDIPNPTYIQKSSGTTTNTELNFSSDGSSIPAKITPTSKVQFNGLAEYILKPVSVLGLPLKCNIIWPNQVLDETLFTDMLNAPTRILLQKSGLPADDHLNVLLTTTKIAGPYIPNCTGFFSSLTPPTQQDTLTRASTMYSDYETEYGMNYTELSLSYAFETSLLEDVDKAKQATATNLQDASSRINSFLNYEFAQRFFASRTYSIQVTPDVDVVPGLPVIVLNQNQEHIICFCTGKSKQWDARGNKSVGLQVAYPRYYYENIDKLGNIVDPTSTNLLAIQELELLFGSKALIRTGQSANSTPVVNINSDTLRAMINILYTEYISGSITYSDYMRNVCSYANWLELYGASTSDEVNMPDSYPNKTVFASTPNGNDLSINTFYVNQVEQANLPNQDIIQKHLDWISTGQRI
jgi:hypothetical protein